MEIEADQVKLYVPENPVYRKVEISGLFCLDSDGNLKYDYAAMMRFYRNGLRF